jgi:PAS domain S-box-containing protein
MHAAEEQEHKAAVHDALAAVRKSEDELRTLIDTMPILAWTARADGAAEFFSRRWIDYMGVTSEQARETGWTASLHPADVQRVVDYWATLVRSREHGEIEARFRRADGEYRWFLIRAAPLLDAEGEVVKWYGTNTDIEDRRRAEEELRRSKTYLEHAQKLSRTGSVGFRVSDRQVFWSEETARIYGYDPAIPPTIEMVLARVHPDDVPKLEEVFRRAAAGGATFDFEHRLLMPDGSIKYIRNLAGAVPDEFGNEEVLGSITDVTEQHEARRALEEALERAKKSEAELRTIIDAIPTQVWSALPDGSAEFQNRTWREYTGMDSEQMRGSGWHVVIHPDDLADYAGWWNRTFETQAPGEAEARFRGWDGVYRWFLSRVVALRDDAGTLVKWYGTNSDVEDLKRAEVELRRSEKVLAEGERISLTGSGSWNLKTGKMVWSAQNCRMLGLDPNEIEPSVELFLQRVHPDDVPRLAPIIESETAARRPYSLDYRVVMPDGAIKHFHTQMRPIVKPTGEVEEYIGVSRDITQGKLAEEAVRRSEQVARGQVEALVRSLDVLATTPAVDEFLVRMLSTIGRLLGATWLAFWLIDEASDTLTLRATVRDGNAVPPDPQHPFMKDPASWKYDPGLRELFATAAPMICEDVDVDPRVPDQMRAYFKAQGTTKFVRLPTLLGGQVKGFIAVFHGERPPYEPAEIELAQALAHQAMLAMQIGRAATLEERNRMARDIHDTLAQGFTAVIVQLQAAEDARARGLKAEVEQHLVSARELARESLNEARRSVRALRPQALENATFWEALQGVVKRATAGTSLRTSFRAHGTPRELPPAAQEHLLHICQEALTNTLKYAHATRFDCRLHFGANELRVRLEDDGVGFNPRESNEGSGVLGMHERAEKIGGTVELRSTADHGTMVVIAVPYAHLSAVPRANS